MQPISNKNVLDLCKWGARRYLFPNFFRTIKANANTTKYPAIGTKKDTDIVERSASQAMMNVPMAPPIGVIIMNEDALLALSPRPVIAIAKIVGNIMDSKA